MKKLSILLIILGLLTGCSEKGTYIKNTTSQDEHSLEEVIMRNEHVKLAKVLLFEDELLAGIRVNTFSGLKKKAIVGIQKKLEKEYPKSENHSVSRQ